MKLTEVESSHVKAVGFIPDVGVLLVQFKNGTVAVRTGVGVDRYLALLESASKGSFLAAMTEQSITIIKGGVSHVAAGNAGTPGETGAKPLNVESSGGRLPGSPAMTLNEMLKQKYSDKDDGDCGFAVVHS